MKKYIFCDYDDGGSNEYDIEGHSFDILIELALKYCKYFSLAYAENIRAVKELDRFEFAFVPSDDLKKKWDCFDIFHSRLPRKYYMLTRESAYILRNIADGIFKFTFAFGCENPEDPAFFREDYSVFFVSVVHEGECYLISKPDEDVSKLVESNEQWREIPY